MKIRNFCFPAMALLFFFVSCRNEDSSPISFLGGFQKEKAVSPTLYVPETRGVVSTDRGVTYRENLKAIEVGQEFYLKFEVAIKTTEKQAKKVKKNIIPFTVTIPATDVFDCTLTDFSGNVTITPASDFVNDVQRYNFVAVASDNPQKYTVIFQCKARNEGSQKIQVTFGNQVNAIHTKNMTLVYNKAGL